MSATEVNEIRIELRRLRESMDQGRILANDLSLRIEATFDAFATKQESAIAALEARFQELTAKP